MSPVLAFDLGGGGLRGGLIDAQGRLGAFAARPAASPVAGGEYDPQDWMRALCEVAADIARADPAGFAAVGAVAICGFTRTQVFLDADGESLRPAIGWADARAAAIADGLRAAAGDRPEAAHLNAYHPLARLVWFAQAEPARFARLTRVLEPKDYLAFRLTGVAAGDAVSQTRLEAARAQGLFEAAGIDAALAPPILRPTDVVGPIRADAPGVFAQLAGRSVVAASHDSWAACVGLGALRVGGAYNLSGTTEVFGLFAPAPVAAPGLLCVDWGGLHHVGGPGQNGAAALDWAMRALTGRDGVGVDALLAGAAAGAPLVFLPYLNGERTPFWDADLRGAFVGLTSAHGPADLARAVLEGVAFHLRRLLERAEAATGLAAAEIRFGGGAARSPIWRSVKADVCRRPIVACDAAEPGLVGVAAAAFVAAGRYAALAQAQDAMARPACRVEPDASRAARYDTLYALFGSAHEALAPISHALAALGRAEGAS
ncbi:MAG: carbohydrate kinase [Rhizobiales bacterium]|nr:carbohydrate kinase [Hyphomicrobiales bacterium]